MANQLRAFFTEGDGAATGGTPTAGTPGIKK